MNKLIKSILSLMLVGGCVSCGGNKDTEKSNLTPIQQQAVRYVKSHLERGDKLVDCQVVEEPMPASIMEQPFLNLRNVVFKAGLDYQSCKTRGLEAGMQMAQQKIEEARQQIIQTEELLTENIGDTNSLIVLAKVKTRKSNDNQPRSIIAVFDPSTMEAKEWIPVTTPVKNTVALVICAQNNTLEEYAKEQNHETQMLLGNTNDPVLKFVLESKAL